MSTTGSLSTRRTTHRFRLPRPSGFAAPTKRQRIVFAVVSALLIAFAIFEWTVYPPGSILSVIHAGIYIALLALLPLWSYQTACLLLVLSISSIFINHTLDGPSDLLGIWYAIVIALILHTSAMPGIAFTLLVTIIQFVGNPSISPSGLTAIAFFNLLAFSLGTYLRSEDELKRKTIEIKLAEQELEQQRQSNELMRHLHDSTAGDLTYALMLLRENQRNTYLAVQILEDSIADIRSIVHSSSDKKLGSRKLKIYEDISQLIMQCEMRLQAMGYLGHPILHCEIEHLSSNVYTDLKYIIEEITTNILKHGHRGQYSLVVNISNIEIEIISSNMSEAQFRGDKDQHFGIWHLQELVNTYHGDITWNHEDNEWTICITLPIT